MNRIVDHLWMTALGSVPSTTSKLDIRMKGGEEVLDSRFLSLRINSQILVLAKPSVAILIFFSNNSFSFLDDACNGCANISAIDLFERLAMTCIFLTKLIAHHCKYL